jgi:hypothetical protein
MHELQSPTGYSEGAWQRMRAEATRRRLCIPREALLARRDYLPRYLTGSENEAVWQDLIRLGKFIQAAELQTQACEIADLLIARSIHNLQTIKEALLASGHQFIDPEGYALAGPGAAATTQCAEMELGGLPLLICKWFCAIDYVDFRPIENEGPFADFKVYSLAEALDERKTAHTCAELTGGEVDTIMRGETGDFLLLMEPICDDMLVAIAVPSTSADAMIFTGCHICDVPAQFFNDVLRDSFATAERELEIELEPI